MLHYLKWNIATFASWNAEIFWSSWKFHPLFFCTWQFFLAEFVCFSKGTPTTLNQHPFTEYSSTKDFLTGAASLAGCRQLTSGWTSCNLLFLFVNDLRFCRGFAWQQNKRWTIMYVLIKSSVFRWTFFRWKGLSPYSTVTRIRIILLKYPNACSTS